MARRGASWQANPKTPLDMQIMMAKWVPGPGQYYQMSDPSAAVRGGKINVSNSKSDIEWAIYRAKTLPGPGQYDIDKAAKAQAKNVRPPRSKQQISPRAACDTHRIQITCHHLHILQWFDHWTDAETRTGAEILVSGASRASDNASTLSQPVIIPIHFLHAHRPAPMFLLSPLHVCIM